MSSNGALRLEDPDVGERSRLGFAAERLDPIEATDDDWAIVDDRHVRRSG